MAPFLHGPLEIWELLGGVAYSRWEGKPESRTKTIDLVNGLKTFQKKNNL